MIGGSSARHGEVSEWRLPGPYKNLSEIGQWKAPKINGSDASILSVQKQLILYGQIPMYEVRQRGD